MPKMKTVSAAKKRFRKKASGKVKASKAFHRHLLTKKSAKTKRGMRRGLYINPSDMKHMDVLLPY